MIDRTIQGVVAAIITPIGADGWPDTAKFLHLAHQLLGGGCDGLNILGTTGEATSFTVEQRLSLMGAIAKSDLPLERLMVGTGAAAQGDACTLTAAAARLGFAGALILPPFYYKDPGLQGIVSYYQRIAAALPRPIPVYLYNFPLLSGIQFDLELIDALVRESGLLIAGLKDSSGDLGYARSVGQRFAQLDVFPSSEAALGSVRNGEFAGCISATANLTAAWCARALHRGDEAALATATSIRDLFKGLPLVPAIKALVAERFGDTALATPLPPLAPPGAAVVEQLIDRWKRLQA